MIKEYFTDGLIGLAILLSIFRTDLVGINNLINYPEVQDIILGQTAAILPTNFHNAPHTLGNPKRIDYDNEAFTAWYQNVNNLPLFRERGENEIEAFLVSASQTNIASEQFQNHHTADSTNAENNTLPEILSPTLPVESANSFVENVTSPTTVENSTATPTSDSSADAQSRVVDVLIFNNPFPGCNLTKEDLDLIEVLWRQDVDLGLGKEVFDQTLRQELERERELELYKQQEKQKAQQLAKEKEEWERQQQADRWLKENFRRDGETGEWVRLHTDNGGSNGSVASVSTVDNNNSDEFQSLEAALDYLSAGVDPSLLQNLEESQEIVMGNAYTDFTNNSVPEGEEQQFQAFPQQQQQYVEHQDSLEESWSGLVDYLNMTANSIVDDCSNVAPDLSQFGDQNVPVTLGSDLSVNQDVDSQSDFLIQNATLPSAVMEMPVEFHTLSPVNEINSSMPLQPTNMDSSIDFDLGDLSFFSNLTTLQNPPSDDLDLAEVDDLFRNMDGTNNESLIETGMSLAESMDAIQLLGENLDVATASIGSPSSHNDFSDAFDGLEGAIGGSDYTSNNGDMSGSYSKVSRLSESNSDSGFTSQGGFSSSSSESSSFAGSPAGSHHGGNSSTTSNDTEHDPHGTRALALHRVAHNHTYNTPPGQVPREVKKYALKEPSRKGPQSRDQRRAQELKIPFTVDQIIESPVETFNEMVSNHKLSEAQLTLVRDIRRRGKNKVAAQNCRKRKVSVIFTLADEMEDLQKARDRLVAERLEMEQETRKMKEKFGHLYTHIFQSLRDERGEPYDPNLYSLQQSSDGNVFLVPRNLTVNKSSRSSSASSSPSSSKDSTGSRKRKSYDE